VKIRATTGRALVTALLLLGMWSGCAPRHPVLVPPAPEAPPTTPTPEPTPAPQVYVVKAGDTLGRIANAQFGDVRYWKAIADHNHIDNPNQIKVGQRLEIPADLAKKPPVVVPKTGGPAPAKDYGPAPAPGNEPTVIVDPGVREVFGGLAVILKVAAAPASGAPMIDRATEKSARLIRRIPNGTQLRCTGMTATYYLVTYDGKEGFLHQQYVEQ
jgi:LysM repeat protein